MNIRCIIFDCDGTLVDSERLAMGLLVEMAAENNITLSLPETTQEFAGMRLHRVAARLEHRHELTLPESFIPDYRRRLLVLLERNLCAMPHIREVLDSLTLPCCVASNAPLEKLRLCLSATGLAMYFNNQIYSACEVGSWKPEPGLFLAAANSMGYPPHDCLVVEDSLPGIHAALEAGMAVIAYRRTDIDDARVQHIDSHAELPAMIDAINR